MIKTILRESRFPDNVSRSLTIHAQTPPLTIGGTVLKESDYLNILGVSFDSKMTFKKNFCSAFRADSVDLGS